MTVNFKVYQHEKDYERVNEFLFRTYESVKYPNWLQARWEYFHAHPGTDESTYDKIGLWEDEGKIVGVITHEGKFGEAYFNVDRNYTYLKKEMLEYAIHHLSIKNDQDKMELAIHVNDFDQELMELADSYGFKKYIDPNWLPEICEYKITDEPIKFDVLEGYTLKSLAVDNDIRKFHRVMWRGFNHPGEAPEEGIEWRVKMQSAPNYNKELNIVLEAPTGHYVAISGVWFDPVNKVGYIEPVCTDPDYRRKGLGKAAVLECVRRCKELGATSVFVESGQQFYKSIGFKPIFVRYAWVKEW